LGSSRASPIQSSGLVQLSWEGKAAWSLSRAGDPAHGQQPCHGVVRWFSPAQLPEGAVCLLTTCLASKEKPVSWSLKCTRVA